jgi:hypothetical protein
VGELGPAAEQVSQVGASDGEGPRVLVRRDGAVVRVKVRVRVGVGVRVRVRVRARARALGLGI